MQDYGYLSVFIEQFPALLQGTLTHVLICGIALILGCLIAIPLGLFLSKTSIQWIRSTVFTVTNIFQTIPSLAMLAMLIPLLGIGLVPAITALFLYSLMPILRNTYEGFRSIDPSVVKSARGMGYSSAQKLFQIEFPLSFPYIMSGIRLTAVYIINWAVLAAVIGAGGLGQLVLGGLTVFDRPLVFAASICAILLTLIIDFLLGRITNRITKQAS